MQSDRPALYKLLGEIYYRAGRITEAIELYKKAIKLDERDIDLYFRIGTLYKHLGMFQESIFIYERGREFCPESVLLLIGLAETYVSVEQRDKVPELIREVRGMAGCDEDEAMRPYLMGELYDVLGDSDKVIECYGNALELKPSHFHYCKLEEAYRKAGKNKLADELRAKRIQRSKREDSGK